MPKGAAFFNAMSQVFIQGLERESFDGYLLVTPDLASIGTVYEFADESIRYRYSLNNSYPDLIDGAGFIINKVPGLPLGTLQVGAVFQGDRGLAAVIEAAFGPRTAGKLNPWLGNLVPYGGGTVRKMAGLWWDTMVISGQFGIQGEDAMIRHSMQGIVIDPVPYSTVPTLSAPASLGTTGLGISSFGLVAVTDGQGSPTTYTDVASFQLTLRNRMRVNRSTKVTGSGRTSTGCTPGTIMGTLVLEQLGGASSPLPQAAGTYPIQITIPTGDGSASTKIDVSVSYDEQNSVLAANDFEYSSLSYTLFSTSAGATATAVWPVVAAYG